MNYDEYTKMKNFAVIIDQDKTNKTTEDNLETRINPKLSNFRKNRALLRKFISTADELQNKVAKTALTVVPLTPITGIPGSGFAAALAYDTINQAPRKFYKNYGLNKFNSNKMYNIDPEKYYIIDYVDDNHIGLLGDSSGYLTRDDAKRQFNESDYLHNRQGVIRINKGVTLLNNYSQKFRRIADG